MQKLKQCCSQACSSPGQWWTERGLFPALSLCWPVLVSAHLGGPSRTGLFRARVQHLGQTPEEAGAKWEPATSQAGLSSGLPVSLFPGL